MSYYDLFGQLIIHPYHGLMAVIDPVNLFSIYFMTPYGESPDIYAQCHQGNIHLVNLEDFKFFEDQVLLRWE